jgi:hypothetical protein
MASQITRANPYLQEIIEILDIHRERYRSDDEALSRLSKDDNQWIDDELLKCMTDARYFISNYYAYRDEKEGFKGLYPLFDSQEILCERYRELERTIGRVRALVLKARQMGSTTYNCAEFFHKTIFAEHVTSIIVGQDEDQSTFIMSMYESALDFIPWWMRPRIKQKQTGALINFDEKDETLRQTRPGLKTWVYADNGRKPSGVGRGKTFGRALLSELAFWQDLSQLSKALFPTFNTPDGFYIMESTANGRNDAWHNLWRRAEAGKVDWEPIFIPFYRREKTYSMPILKTEVFVLTKDEIEMKERVFKKESYLIKPDMFNWMRKKKEEFIATDGDDMMFAQEYTSEPEESFQSSAITAFPRGVINRHSKRTRNPVWLGEIYYDFERGKAVPVLEAIDDTFELPYPEQEKRFSVWERPVRGERYCVGVDVSLGNEGGDYSCISVVKLSSGHEIDAMVACWHGLINPEPLAEIVLAVCWWYNEALAAVEVNSMGMVTNTLLMRDYEYQDIYRFKRMDRLKHFITDIVGWWTDYKSKRALVSKMDRALRENMIDIPCKFTIDEFRDFSDDLEADGDGAHDDFVMALMIALYCGHEGEVNERHNKPAAPPPSANKFFVFNRENVLQLETTSQAQAELTASKIIGSRIERIAGATAILKVGEKKIPVPADYQNTAHSPIHDKEGTAHKLHYDEGVPEEEITSQMIAEYDQREEEMEENPEAWMYE